MYRRYSSVRSTCSDEEHFWTDASRNARVLADACSRRSSALGLVRAWVGMRLSIREIMSVMVATHDCSCQGVVREWSVGRKSLLCSRQHYVGKLLGVTPTPHPLPGSNLASRSEEIIQDDDGQTLDAAEVGVVGDEERATGPKSCCSVESVGRL